MDPILRVVITVALIALVVWVLLYAVPMPYPFGTVLVAVAIIGCVIYAYRAFGGSTP